MRASAWVTACTATFCTSYTCAEDAPATLDKDGTFHAAALTTLPASEFWSSQFKQDYVDSTNSVMTRRDAFTAPTANAPKAEWDKFDANSNRFFSGYLDWAREHYPVDIVDTKLGGVHIGRITPKGGIAAENKHRILINLHGGGFYNGRGLTMGAVESIPLVSIGKIEVVTIDYRQSPYFKFPAGIEDVEAVYKELLKQYKPDAIGIFGSSAGGVLAAQAVVGIAASGLPRPGAIGMFWAGPGPFWSPVFSKQGDSAMWLRAIYPDNTTGGVPEKYLSNYMDGADAHDALANPGSSDDALAKFPATLFITGTRSFDMSPAIVAHARLLKLGVDSSLYVMEGGWHSADIYVRGTTEQRDVDAYKASWFDHHLAR